MNPKVSFIIPALNAEKTLRLCLEAIFRQTTGSDVFEVILLDNGSTDRTVEIAKEFGVKIIDAPGLTVAALRNLGARRAQGEILAYVDADCVIAPDWLEKALPFFNDPRVGAVGAPTLIPENATWVQRAWYLQRKGSDKAQEVEWLPTENLLVRKEAFEKINGFDERLITCEDVDFCYRLGKFYKIISAPQIRSVHLGEASSLAHFFRKERWRGKGNLKGVFSHGLKLSELPSLLLPIYYLLGTMFFIVAVFYLIGTKKWWPLGIASLILSLPPIFLAMRTCLKNKNFVYFPHLVLLYFTYAFARMLSIVPTFKRSS
jgi:glycosyltransferase involved in cell wall biosynthesis